MGTQTTLSEESGRFVEFQRAQDVTLAEYGVEAASRYVDITEPRPRVHVLEAGSADPVVTIHGGNGVAAMVAPIAERLSQGFHLFMPDRPGCGLTTPMPFNYRGVDIRSHGVDYIGSTLDALGLERASLVGNSIGGYFGLVYALAHPKRVSKIALVGEPAGGPTAIPAYTTAWWAHGA